ncbi:MAG: type II toxin-antitoxin system RelE/ParE family toxin [Proteobacteria bacterium]|nr:type II toxin-antitoxin system RelE/ParE family toxin [Pseudomonadota bacterium]
MLKLIISPQAREDLFEIWFYIAEDSTINADRFIDKLTEKYHWLTEFPEAGVKRDDLASNLQSFPVDRYMLYYKSTDKTLEIVRVLHSSRNIDQIFH